MIARRSLLLAAICLVLTLQSTLVSGRRRKEKRPRHEFTVVHNVSCEGVVRNKFTVNLEMNQVYEFATMGDKKKKCTVRYKTGHCRAIMINTTFLNLKHKDSKFFVDAPNMEPIVGVKNNDEHSPDFLNMSIPEVLQGGDFEIRFESGPDSVGKLSQVTTEITCVNGTAMKPFEERKDCQCGLIKPHMMVQTENSDPRDHNRDKRSLDEGQIQIETPWMEYNDTLDAFVVTIGDNYKLSFLAPPKQGEPVATLPDNSIRVDGTEFVLHMTDQTDVEFNETHQPACLPKHQNLRDLDNEKVFVIKREMIDEAATGKLEVVPMKVMDRYHCNELVSQSIGEEDYKIDNATGCLMPHRRSELCEDSIGSPIFAYTDRKTKTHLKLIGFVSGFLSECAKKKMPAAFARLNNPGLAELHEIIMNNGSQPLLTCPDHPPINNCAKENGEPFYCPTGCCGHECCIECVKEINNETVICTGEGEVCCPTGCCMQCPPVTCSEGQVCCEEMDGCCNVCNGQTCPDTTQGCRTVDGECEPLCGDNTNPCDGECCAEDSNECCVLCAADLEPCPLGIQCMTNDTWCQSLCGGATCDGDCCANDENSCCPVCYENAEACVLPDDLCRLDDLACSPRCNGIVCDGECCAADTDECCELCWGTTCLAGQTCNRTTGECQG